MVQEMEGFICKQPCYPHLTSEKVVVLCDSALTRTIAQMIRNSENVLYANPFSRAFYIDFC